MRIFISWSGDRSKIIAQSLRKWLPKVIQAVDPWMSNEDIESGMKWSNEISGELEKSNFGIICITNENQNNPWITFEAGALSKIINSSNVCPFLFDLEPSQLSGPVSQFQARKTDREGTLKILRTINNSLVNNNLKEEELEEIFEVWWPRLQSDFDKIPEYDGEKVNIRSTEEILSEIVINTREQLRREEIRMNRSSEMDKKFDRFISFIESYEEGIVSNFKDINLIKSKFLDDNKHIDENTHSNFEPNLTELINNLKDLKKLDKTFTEKLLDPKKHNPEEDTKE